MTAGDPPGADARRAGAGRRGGRAAADGWTTVPGPRRPGHLPGRATEYRIATDAAGELVVRLPEHERGADSAGAIGPGRAGLVRWPDEATLVLAG